MNISPKFSAQRQPIQKQPIQRCLSTLGVSFLLLLQLANAPAAAVPKPPSRSLPQTKEAGAARSCGVDGVTKAEKYMVAMVPDYPSERAFVRVTTGSYTAQSAPELWASLPYSPEQLQSLTFKILNAEKEVHYEVDLEVPEQAGLLKVQWPESKPLEAGERYRWSLTATIDCGGAAPVIQKTSAWVERYEIDGAIPEDRQLLDALSETDDPIVQAELYSEAYLWYDAFALLAAKRQAKPAAPDVQQAWHRLLSLHGLCDWSMQSFVDSADHKVRGKGGVGSRQNQERAMSPSPKPLSSLPSLSDGGC